MGFLAVWYFHLAVRPGIHPYEHWTSFLAIVGVLAVLVPQQFVGRVPLGLALFILIAVYALGRYIWFVPPDSGSIPPIMIEPVLLISSTCLAHALVVKPAERQPGLFLRGDQAHRRIDIEMARSRRHGRALSIILIDFRDDTEHSCSRSCFLFEEAVSGQLRRSDLGVALGETDPLVLICLETDLEGCHSYARRIAAIVGQHGRSPRLASACFPRHALTFAGLLEYAEQQLQEQQLQLSREPTGRRRGPPVDGEHRGHSVIPWNSQSSQHDGAVSPDPRVARCARKE